MQGVPTLKFPFNPTRATVTWQVNPIRFKSAWAGNEQRFRRYGMWKLSYDWSLLSRQDFGTLMALFNGYADAQFTTYDVTRVEPSGVALSTEMNTLQVNGIGQTGRSLVLKNAPTTKLCFRAGDLIGVNTTGEVYELSQDATSVGTTLTVNFNQYIRTSPGDSADIVVNYVPIKVWLNTPVVAEIQAGPILYAIKVDMVEAL